MILDLSTSFARSLAVNAAAGTALVGDQVDLGAGLRNPFRGVQPMYLVLTVNTTFTSGGAATVNIKLSSDASAAIATDGSATDLWQTGVLGFATLVAGRRWIIPVPQDPDPERFVGILVVTAAATTTAGAITAELTAFPPSDWVAYSDAVN